jgi:hypothetical protein
MTDDERLARFEDATIDPFHHRDHVWISWLHLRRFGLFDSLARVSRGIRGIARAHGQESKYHASVTALYVFVIHERIETDPLPLEWPAFEARHADLFGNWGRFVGRYYSPERLRSPLARRTFLLPDLAGPEVPNPPRASLEAPRLPPLGS